MGTGGEEAADQRALEWLDGVGLRHTDDGGGSTGLGQDVPDPPVVDGVASGDGHVVVGMVGPVAEAIEAQDTGVFAREHRSPGRDGDAGNRTGERAVDPLANQPAQVGELVFQPQAVLGTGVEQHRWRGAIQPCYKDFAMLTPFE